MDAPSAWIQGDRSFKPESEVFSNFLAALFFVIAIGLWILGGWRIYRSSTWRPWFSLALTLVVFGFIHLGLWFAFGR